MTNWLIDWGVPALIIASLFCIAWALANRKAWTLRRFHPPMHGANGLYIREKWEPREFDRDWAKRLRQDVWRRER